MTRASLVSDGDQRWIVDRIHRGDAAAEGELLELYHRRVSQLKTVAVRNRAGELSANVGFAAAIAEFGMMLRRSDYRGTASFEAAAALATKFRGADPDGYRAEFIRLVELAGALTRPTRRE